MSRTLKAPRVAENLMAHRTSKLHAFSIIALLMVSGATCATSQDGSQERRTSFDDDVFKGWEGNLSMFRIEDGAVVAGTLSEPIARNEFLCTEEEFDDFELRLEFKLLGGERANAGIQFRSQRIPDHHEVVGYQADMGDGWWGALYDESRRNRVLAASDLAKVDEVLKRDDWNEYVIRAEGRRIRLAINGLETVDYTEPDESIPQSGKVCVQIHSGPPSEAWYRNISIEP